MLIGLILNSTAWAYTDPIDTSAIKMASARNHLLLDVATVGERLVAVGERGHILISTDRGHSWQQADVPSQIQLNALYFVDDVHGWAVGEDAVILHSANGGLSWQRQFDDREAGLAAPLLDVYFKNNREGFAIGAYGRFLFTRDGGASWMAEPERLENADGWHLSAIAAVEDRFYIAGEAGTAYRSLDGGVNWQALSVPHGGSLLGVAVKVVAGNDWVVLYGVGGAALVSRDGGDSWQPLPLDIDKSLAGGTWLADGSLLLVGSDALVVRFDPELATARTLLRPDRLPLSAVRAWGEQWILVGLGGLQSMSDADFSLDSPH